VSDSPELILKSNGEPFATVEAAKAALTRKGVIEDEYEVVEYPVKGAGYAIKSRAKGQAVAESQPEPGDKDDTVKTLENLRKDVPDIFVEGMRAQGLISQKHPNTGQPVTTVQAKSKMNGLKIDTLPPDQASDLLNSIMHLVASNAEAEKIYKVIFNAKTNPNDQDDVHLAVNGEQLVLKREEIVFLPGRFLEAARNATVPQFRQLPNKPRKVVGKVNVYPFEIKGEGTRQDFLNMLRVGTARTKEHVEKYGMAGGPEE
jgi:hypothetical protein